MEKLPIVYVRGYAGGTRGINKQVDDPFYGFNDGSTHVRVDGDGAPKFYQFESPLLRLMTDESYQVLVGGNQEDYLRRHGAGAVAKESIWVCRFYDQAATTFQAPVHRSLPARIAHSIEDRVAAPRGFDIESAAAGLYEFILLVREKTGADKVHLVAHSMGGLLARCMLQKICQKPDANGTARLSGRDVVARFFTYDTPHGGIDFDVEALDWVMEAFGPAGSDIFAPEKMYGYLDPKADWGDEAPRGWDPQRLPADILGPDNVFCLVGTDASDYGVARDVVGPKSDGLVTIDKAYVRGAHRAYVHRSHSGRYGVVNSEEGYQNLRRFLFGGYQVKVDLLGLTPPDGQPQEVWQADVRLAVRSLPILLHEQVAAHYCPIQLDPERRQHEDRPGAPIPLTTVFLLDPARGRASGAPEQRRARYTLSLRVFHLTEEHGGFLWSHHLEQVADWEDALIVDVGRPDEDPDATLRTWIAWNSAVAGPPARYDPITEGLSGADRAEAPRFTRDDSVLSCDVPLPEISRRIPMFGGGARLRLTVTERG